MMFYKILTHDFRPPLQGGAAIWDGKTLPFKLNGVTLDKSDQECAAGWNFVDSIETGFKIAGMWPTGRPSEVLIVEPSDDKIQRGNKWRASTLTICKRANTEQINSAIERFSEVFGAHSKEMSREQILWRESLSRPYRNIDKVIESLELALKTRGLDWKLKEYQYAWAAWDARDARAARDAWAARAARDAWDAWAALDAWAARAARAAWAAWDAWDAWAARAAWAAWAAWDAWDAWAARDALDARAALTVQFSSLQSWITQPKDFLTKGIRDAYLNGLEIALPTEDKTLAFSMNP